MKLQQYVIQSSRYKKDAEVAEECEKVFKAVQKNPKATYQEIAEATGLDERMIYSRLQKLRKMGFIKFVQFWEISPDFPKHGQ